MKKEHVPQDDANVLEGKTRVLKYAVDENGNYTKVHTVGWEPENIVLSQAWDDIHEKAESVRQQVLSGKLSPIAFHMEREMLDLNMLSQYVGYSAFRVRLHLKPWFFRRLSTGQLEKYARAFRISVEELKNINPGEKS